MLLPASIALVILGYAFIMSKLGVTKFKPRKNWKDSLKDIITTGFPVAIVEEFIFRYLIMYQLLIVYLGLSIPLAFAISAVFFSLVHFLWGMYKHGSEHQTKTELACLGVGLTLFGLVTAKLFFIPYANIIWHAFAIYGVQLTARLFTNEEERNWFLWDNGHQLVRTGPMWLVLIAWFLS